MYIVGLKFCICFDTETQILYSLRQGEGLRRDFLVQCEKHTFAQLDIVCISFSLSGKDAEVSKLVEIS